VDDAKDHDVHIQAFPSEDEPQKRNEREKPKESKPPYARLYMPPLLFPQQFTKAKPDAQFGKFLDVLKKLYVNIPLLMLCLKCLCTLSF